MTARLRDLPASARLALFAFVVLVGGFYALAHATLWERDGGGRLPGPEAILVKYRGSPTASRLHGVLAADVPSSSSKAMWLYLDPLGDPEAIARRRGVVLDWVEAGAPETGWEAVRTVLHQEATCLQCHAFGGERADLPMETYEQVRPLAATGGGMQLGPLLVSAHNHVFGFAVLALILSVLAAFTALPSFLKILLTTGAFTGAAADIAGWFLTRSFGAPWQYAVLLGGALYGLCVAGLMLAVLQEVLRRRPRGVGAG